MYFFGDQNNNVFFQGEMEIKKEKKVKRKVER